MSKNIEFDSHKQSAQVATNLKYDPKAKEQSQRDAYADLLSTLGDAYPDLMVVDADLSTVGKTFGFAETGVRGSIHTYHSHLKVV